MEKCVPKIVQYSTVAIICREYIRFVLSFDQGNGQLVSSVVLYCSYKYKMVYDFSKITTGRKLPIEEINSVAIELKLLKCC